MLSNISVGLLAGGSLALVSILMVAQGARIRRYDLRLRSRWGFGLVELLALSIGWGVVATLAWWGRGTDPMSFQYEVISLGVIVLSAAQSFATVFLLVLGRRKR